MLFVVCEAELTSAKVVLPAFLRDLALPRLRSLVLYPAERSPTQDWNVFDNDLRTVLMSPTVTNLLPELTVCQVSQYYLWRLGSDRWLKTTVEAALNLSRFNASDAMEFSWQQIT